MENNYRIWMVRAGSGGYLIEEFLQNNIIAIGWNDMG
jgi:restriction system protein